MEEAKPLLKDTEPAQKAPKAEPSGTEDIEAGVERDWDGHLLAACGDCDQHGIQTFAYVKGCSPVAWIINVQRAFPKGIWKTKKYEHIVVFLILLGCWIAYFNFAAPPPPCAGPRGPHHPVPHPEDFHDPKPRPEDKQILSGATLNIDLENLFPEDSLAWTKEDPTEDLPKPDAQLVQNQVQEAKLKAAESMSQLEAGRKLLHKHDDDDDDEDDHKGHHDKDDDDHHKEKKKDKKKKKKDKHADKGKGKKQMKDDKDSDPAHREEHDFADPAMQELKGPLDGPPHPHPRPGCVDDPDNSVLSGLLIITSIIVVVYATEMRTAIRKRFGIKGSKCGDCMAWTFCGPCALCQETRTLAKYNVHRGVWHGETLLVDPAAEPLEAPIPVEAPTKPV